MQELHHTCEIHCEIGNPRSLENAHSSLETVTSVVMLPTNIKRKRIIMSSRATRVDPVLRKRNRYGASELSTSFKSPIPNNIAKYQFSKQYQMRLWRGLMQTYKHNDA